MKWFSPSRFSCGNFLLLVLLPAFYFTVPFYIERRSRQQTQTMPFAQLKISRDASPLKQEWQGIEGIKDYIAAGKEGQKPPVEPSFFQGRTQTIHQHAC